jgi:hypothetical protein
MSAQTTRGTAGTLRLAGQPDLPVTCLLRHDAAEPALVRVVIVLSEDGAEADAAELAVDRSLLTDGVTGDAHDEDVRVSVLGTQVYVVVGALTVLLGLAGVVDFLLETYQAAPTGSEADVVIALTEAARELSQA